MRRAAVVVLGLVGVLGVAGCTGDKPDDPRSGSSSPQGSTTSSVDGAGAAAKLLTDLKAENGDGIDAPKKTVELPGKDIEVGVVSLTARPDSTILVLAAKTSSDGKISPNFTGGEGIAWRDLHGLSLEDKAGRARYYPYRYQWQPKTKNLGSLTPAEGRVHGVDVWRPWGAIVLPPLPTSTTVVDVNYPGDLDVSVRPKPLAVIKDVPVTRS